MSLSKVDFRFQIITTHINHFFSLRAPFTALPVLFSMDFAAYDFGASGDNGKGDHSSQNQQHAMDGSVDFFSFADVPADYHGNDPTTMNMDYSQDLGSSFAMTQFGNHDAQQLQDNMMLQGHGHVGNSAQYDMSPAHTPLNRPHGMGSIFGEDEVLYKLK